MKYKFDSHEEEYFQMWIDELVESGFIDKYEYQPESFHLNDPVKFTIEKQLKTKTKLIEQTLLQERNYTADFKIFWNKKAENIFFQNLESIKESRPLIIAQNDISYIDVKGNHNQHSSWGTFEANRKDVYLKYNIFIEKIQPIGKKTCLFGKSFTPKKLPIWQKRNSTKKYAWVKWKVIFLEDFLLTKT